MGIMAKWSIIQNAELSLSHGAAVIHHPAFNFQPLIFLSPFFFRFYPQEKGSSEFTPHKGAH